MDAGRYAQSIIELARNQQPLIAAAVYAFVNILGTSVMPIPIGVIMMVVAGVIWGQWLGLAIYIVTCATGAWITFIVTRCMRTRIIALLGPHAATWRRLDAAITREGLWISLLWRVAPIAPFVLSSAMIAMTEISQFDYMWTTFLGIIPSSYPVVTGEAAPCSWQHVRRPCTAIAMRPLALLFEEHFLSFPPKDPHPQSCLPDRSLA